ncbi:M15 family metallopeptidase [Gracilibacillus sp. D59]|uniref:M15 family metallopeptidase n=1 Tax=Gracilibacillus sp. D59 TaxID=3457434 RepID=UPI003FCE6943
MKNTNNPIPQQVHPDFKQKDIPIKDCGEPLIKVSEYNSKRITEHPMYHQWNINGALPHCYLRESVLHALEKAAYHLPDGYQFVIWDGYRPFQVQKAIYDQFYNQIKQQYPQASEADWKEKTEQFVSYPSVDAAHPAPHITGGAVDLTIRNDQDTLLDFGTAFDDFSAKANTAYYEKKKQTSLLTKQEEEILANRRMLYHILIDQGFTNYHQEWWHFDYGNQWWAQNTEKPAAIYGVAQFKGE